MEIEKIENVEKKVNLSVNKLVFLPPWILLVALVAVSLLNEELFLSGLNAMTGWVLDNFAWAFNLTTLFCVFTVIIVYFSPLARVRIGGRQARPMLKFSSLVWITLCTTIAAGILFWACGEPMYQMYGPAAVVGAEPGSQAGAMFAMQTMYLEWTWSPYGIYTVATLTFAFVFYNMKESFSIGSVLVPAFGKKARRFNPLVDIICLFALVAGVAASLGTGTFTIAGGIERIFGIKSAPPSWGIIIIVIVVTFVVSSVSGIMKGIRILSDINSRAYMILLLFLLIFGPTAFMLNFAVESWGEYAKNFFSLSLATGEIFQDGWAKSWPVFYWCNWLAWTPTTGVFLGRILKGYTIKDAIHCNFVIPAIFSTIWMGLFSTAAIYYDMNGLGLYEKLLEKGPEAVVYAVFDQLPFPMLIIPFYLFIVFISFVTASDSNTNAMAGLCTKGITQNKQESPSYLKVVWGISIAAMTWVLISFAGIDGIKAASNLGGFPNLFLMLIMIFSLLKICRNPMKYDVNKEDYDSKGIPIPSERLPNMEEE